MTCIYIHSRNYICLKIRINDAKERFTNFCKWRSNSELALASHERHCGAVFKAIMGSFKNMCSLLFISMVSGSVLRFLFSLFLLNYFPGMLHQHYKVCKVRFIYNKTLAKSIETNKLYGDTNLCRNYDGIKIFVHKGLGCESYMGKRYYGPCRILYESV